MCCLGSFLKFSPPTHQRQSLWKNEYRTRHIHTGLLRFFSPYYQRGGVVTSVLYIKYSTSWDMRPLRSLQSARCSLAHVVLSSSSFASLTFVAKYGLPPRSGWFKSISVRCALRTLSFEMDRSLHRIRIRMDHSCLCLKLRVLNRCR